MTTTLASIAQPDAQAIERVLIGGDLSKLTEPQRLAYYNSVCQSLGLNPLTKPFDYITLQGKLTLYARRDATEQLRKIHGVSIVSLEKTKMDDLYVVTATATDRTGRTDASTGAVALAGLKGENLANAIMKAETKAKRRVTLSICGLGMLDETEAADVAGAVHVPHPATVTAPAPVTRIEADIVDTETGEVLPPHTDGALRIASVEPRPTQTGKERWLVTLSDGREAWTFSQQLSGLASDLCQSGTAVLVETKDKGKWGHDLVNVARAAQAEPPMPADPPADIDADDLPF